MKKETILTALEQALDRVLVPDYDYAIDFDSFHHRIAVYFRIFVENKEAMMIEDESGTLANDIIEFEDAILFHQSKDNICDTDYLVTFSFDRKNGLERAVIEATAQTLRETLDEGLSDLIDFVTDETKEEFELVFNDEYYQEALAQATKRYGNEMVKYPKF